ncbi:hypothetical protein F5884DRAFT_754969 [Xylogone sp. PMI_703]|nr:hypothetical protein F5884DRAFT_754969 [Xylogone sp. PMI_703]
MCYTNDDRALCRIPRSKQNIKDISSLPLVALVASPGNAALDESGAPPPRAATFPQPLACGGKGGSEQAQEEAQQRQYPSDRLVATTSTETSLRGIQGLIGLGPSTGSNVLNTLSNSSGDPALDRIFQNTSIPNIVTFYLNRENNPNYDEIIPGPLASGQLSIGTILSGLEDVQSMPKLPALTLLDTNAIGPDGSRIVTKTTIDNPDNGTEYQYHVDFDTRANFPSDATDAADSGVYTFHCSYELNVFFVFHGIEYPIHPLDVSLPAPSALQVGITGVANDMSVCVSSFVLGGPGFFNHSVGGGLNLMLSLNFRPSD